ncbi:unnamed protein product [Boreogadus saida]
MEPAQSASPSPGFSDPEISEVEPQSTPKVFTMWWLVVLTFLAQLSLVLFVLWKCWRYDRTAREKKPKPGSYNLMINSNQDDIVIKTADSESPGNEAQSSTTLLSPAMSGPCCWVEEERRHYPGNGFMPGQPIHWDIAYY